MPALLLAAVLAGCGGGDGATGACGPDRREALDPTSAHVLTGGDDPADYRTDPPTSGPHQPTPALGGTLQEPLTRALQVGHLEDGGVLLQYRDLDDAERASLESLAADGIAVAPNPELPTRVVATAWLRKVECSAVEIDTLEAFVRAHLGEGPGSDG